MMFRVHLSLAAQFAQLQSSTIKFSLMLFGTAGSKELILVAIFIFSPAIRLEHFSGICVNCLNDACCFGHFRKKVSIRFYCLQC